MKWKDIKFWIWVEVTFPEGAGDELMEASALEKFKYEDKERIFGINYDYYDECNAEIDCPECIQVCFDVIAFASEFELNAIPTASVSVALGRRADNVGITSEIHTYINDLKLQLPAKVWCMVKTADGSNPTDVEELWPPSKFLIFEGYVTGSGFRRNASGAELTLSLTHWLTDLNFSSSLSKQSHPLNPSQIYLPAAFTAGVYNSSGSTLDNGGPAPITHIITMPFFDGPTIVSDFWSGPCASTRFGLKNFLLYLTRTDRINQGQIDLLAPGSANSPFLSTKNWEACRALQRFEPNASGPDFFEDDYLLGVPLAIADNILSVGIANSIGESIGFQSQEAYSNMTLWDKLAGQLHAEFLFAVVPLVRKALVVPYVPALQAGTDDALIQRTIRTSQYESIELSGAMIRPVRAVGVSMDMTYVAGYGMGGPQHNTFSGFGGWFDKMTLDPDGPEPDPAYREGLILFKRGPSWLSLIIQPARYSADATGLTADGGIRTSTDVNAGQPASGLTPNATFDLLAGFSYDTDSIWNQYARYLYITEALKARQGMITGPVRFDIAPGSSIKVEVTEDKWVKELYAEDPTACLPQDSQYFYASVLRVSTNIDCQNMRASTSFYVAHIRNEAENQDRGTSAEKHPLWQRCQWGGCVLVQDDAFFPFTAQICPDIEGECA